MRLKGFRRFSPTFLLLLGLTLACEGAAKANSFQIGAFVTYTESDWSDQFTSAGMVLDSSFTLVYAPVGGSLALGILSPPGFYMLFGDPLSVQAYLPATGTPAALSADLVDPTTTPSGAFGGEVTALQLNVDFQKAGLLLGTSGIALGNLVLTNLSTCSQLDGLTVTQFLAIDNTALGGGSTTCNIANLDAISANLNVAFMNGIPSSFADTNLALPGSVTPTPEPSSLLLVASSLAGLGFARRRMIDREIRGKSIHREGACV